MNVSVGEEERSNLSPFLCGVAQYLGLSLLFSNVCLKVLGEIIWQDGMQHHQHLDDASYTSPSLLRQALLFRC